MPHEMTIDGVPQSEWCYVNVWDGRGTHEYRDGRFVPVDDGVVVSPEGSPVLDIDPYALRDLLIDSPRTRENLPSP